MDICDVIQIHLRSIPYGMATFKRIHTVTEQLVILDDFVIFNLLIIGHEVADSSDGRVNSSNPSMAHN